MTQNEVYGIAFSYVALPVLVIVVWAVLHASRGGAFAAAFLRVCINLLEPINRLFGYTMAWLALFMVLTQFSAVLMRYVFGINYIWLQESVVYAHGLLFMLAAGYALLIGGHVRVDIFYRAMGAKRQALIDILGTVFLLMPMAALVLIVALPYVEISWRVLEGSKETSGLPFIYLLKTAIPLFSGLIALQGVALTARSLRVLLGLEPPPERHVP